MTSAPPIGLTLADLSDPAPEPSPLDWNDDGVLILPRLMPDNMIDAYEAEWATNNGLQGLEWLPDRTTDDGVGLARIAATRVGGYYETAYMHHPALMAMCTYQPLADALESLMGEPAGVHLNLSGWVSTKRDWHQDCYLNPAHVGPYYAAVWIALGDVHPDSGPFEYVPGSHRWHELKQEKVLKYVNGADPEWPAHTERILTPLVEAEIEARGASRVTYLPKRGDVLIWHGRLYHRGTVPNLPGAYRPALIAHFSGRNHRRDMPAAVQSEHGGWYMPITHQAELSRAARMKRGE